MKTICVNGHCDRAMLVPQPDCWAYTFDEVCAALQNEGPFDEMSLHHIENDRFEDLGIFLRDNPSLCPGIIHTWNMNPLIRIKFNMWLPGKMANASFS